MFEGLSGKLQTVFRRVRGEGRITEGNIQESLREIRMALLEADVHFRVVKELLARVRERALGEEVLRSLTPGQHFVSVVKEAIEGILGDGTEGLRAPGTRPGAVLLVGLQGSGKTTTAAKLGARLRREGHAPLLVPCDVRRPAATEQLRGIAGVAGVAFHDPGRQRDPLTIARDAMADAAQTGYDVVVVDTAGRLHIDDALMQELAELEAELRPFEILYVADAMTGQDAVRSAGEFHRRLPLTGMILTKLDGDARGGAALSVTYVTGLPVKFVGTGERIDNLEPFHPDRMASRILGMGDILTLAEKARSLIQEEDARRLEKKLRGPESLDLEDFRQQLRRLRRMGPLGQLLELIPGMGASALPGAMDEGELTRVEAIIDSMTPEERRDPSLLNGRRKRRIALGSGTSVQDVNRLLKQFVQLRKMMKSMVGAGLKGGRGTLPPIPGR